jgi:hypothetical protein
MGAAVMGAIIAARERVFDTMRASGATQPDVAIERPDLHGEEARQWDELCDAGVIGQTPDGRYYLDEVLLAQTDRGRLRRLRVVLLVVPLLIIAAIIVVAIRAR